MESTEQITTQPQRRGSILWPGNWRWKPTSLHELMETEQKMLKPIGKSYEQKLVKIGEEYINTLIMGQGPPLVLLHGFGAGLGFWVCNLKDFSKNHTVYAIDLLGFGRSSRMSYKGKTPEEAETYFISAFENWRKEMNLAKFTLLGHSFGGYLSSAYSLKHPERVHHLILADPWGIPERPPEDPKRKIPWRWRIARFVASNFAPLSIVRAAGPYGPSLIAKFRSDIAAKFEKIYEDTSIVSQYIYHLNAQDATGELAFSQLTSGIAWAHRPMIHRLPELQKNIPVTLMYGAHTWMDSQAGYELKEKLGSRADYHIIKGAGHHIYVDNFPQFNSVVVNVLAKYPLKSSVAYERPGEEKPDEGVEVVEDVKVKQGDSPLPEEGKMEFQN